MSLFNKIERVQYTNNSDKELVSLTEYILFNDERANSKYIVFKFKNNLAQLLFEIKVEVLQYNEDGELIERSILHYTDKEGIKALDNFVPNLKFKTNYATKSISVSLIYGRFDKIIYENGETVDNPLTFNEYHKSLPKKEAVKVKKKVKKDVKERKVEKKKSKKKSAQRKATIKNVKNQNVNKFTRGLTTVLSIALLVYGVVGAIYHANTATEMSYGDFDIVLHSNGQDVYITGYNGTSTDVYIPRQLGQYNVRGIYNKAFDEKSIVCNILIESEYCEIKQYAFYKCESLQNIYIYGSGYVSSNAFVDCNNLYNISFDQGTYTYNSVVDCDSLNSISFMNTYCPKLGDIFGLSNEKVTVKEVYDYTGKDYETLQLFYEGTPETLDRKIR